MVRYPLYDILPLGTRFWVLYSGSCQVLNFAISLFELPGSVNEFVGIIRTRSPPVDDIESGNIYGFYTLML
ncbi:hypothetical protein SUGI_0769410 [Cryptomeria japonica]|nr:hypothetical protein SUGI_0769410 [Cryptomeria japonica]